MGLPLRPQRIKYPSGKLSGKIPACMGDNPSQAFNRFGFRERPSLQIGFYVSSAILSIIRIPSSR
jgi:hypothetical protein